ncbi:hypothetical protein TraAM80_06173 [Trypanosoma rangeli]|uniref:Uncharacterized protein n=1 Tax=Trypanosoma rangeli TaxID=5698 RepID=A0A422NBA7_TRYRA|nr:uncharacterized protein TraAM80_06173 [Trypanosoma rangeli]RNF02722.1 hypothetical protein TraAM80_06173 [Trypanosoma rangeli]|eukprot:RNF02722.1 hypothetical protein TraAM80_06173 [Trypanosoma rangeli]
MGKLRGQPSRMQTMEVVPDDLHGEMSEVRDSARRALSKELASSCRAVLTMQNGNTDQHGGGDVWHFQDEDSAPHASKDVLKLSAEEMRAWKTASLPQLLSMRKNLFFYRSMVSRTSLHGRDLMKLRVSMQ